MNSIGGYFELELCKGEEYHKEAIKLNTGRNAFEYILRAKNYKKVYLPYYTCDVMLEPIIKLNLESEFYHIDETLRPLFDFTRIQYNEVFVYTNYFGICNTQVTEVINKSKNIIIDNSQSFFSKPELNIDTFYSARKFFGVPDGAYLYINKKLQIEFVKDISINRFEHLLGRIEFNPENYFNFFKNNDAILSDQPILEMSNLTNRLLESIDYEQVANIRKNNFEYINEILKFSNKLSLEISESTVPLVYPYLDDNGYELKSKLIKNNIYVATYWPNVMDWCDETSMEYKISKNLVCLPIDQRFDIIEMKNIINILRG